MSSNTGVSSTDYNRDLISDSETDFILAGCRVNCRLDGRQRLDFRPYQIISNDSINNGDNDTELLPLSHGSARLIGSTGHAATEQQHLLCSVKAELVRPSVQAPRRGVVELHVTSGPGPPKGSNGNTTTPTKRDLDRAQQVLSQLLDGRWVDANALCCCGDVVWKLAVDVLVVEAAGGSLVDCAARVIAAGLAATQLPHVVTSTGGSSGSSNHDTATMTTSDPTTTTSIRVDTDYAKSRPIPLPTILWDSVPTTTTLSVCIITVAVLQDFDLATKRPLYSLIVDATLAEEACALALVHVGVQWARTVRNDDGLPASQPPTARIVGLHKTQPGALPLVLLPDIAQTALEAAEKADAAFVRVRNNTSSSLPKRRTTTNQSTLLQEQFQWVMVDHR
mmetsp:Transcript_29466/g.68736  ORF Transcript_29466/g.68736 Transcript_29466/m.68736 type:complete len:393 (-) Transcript_29466:65-1243(-)